MAMRWGMRVLLGGALLASMAATALAQKPPAAPGPAGDRLAGYWVFNRQTEADCRVTRMMAGMLVRPGPRGDYVVTSRRAMRQTAGRGCPPMGASEKVEDLEGAMRVQGDLVAVVLRGRDGRMHTFGYRLGENTLTAECTDCIERGTPWRRTRQETPPPR